MTASLLLIGAALASWITLRNPGYSTSAEWPTPWEWAVGTFGVLLMTAAACRVMWSMMLAEMP